MSGRWDFRFRELYIPIGLGVMSSVCKVELIIEIHAVITNFCWETEGITSDIHLNEVLLADTSDTRPHGNCTFDFCS